MLLECVSRSMSPVRDTFAFGGAEAECIQYRLPMLRLSHALFYMQAEQPIPQRSFFTELLASMSDLKFSRCGRHMLARNFMGLKLWDVRMEAAPVATFPIHEHLKHKVGSRDMAT